MSEALLLSLIHKLDINYREDETNVQMELVIKEMREILDIVKDKKLEEGRSLNFLVSDLVDVADDALDRFKKGENYFLSYESIHSWIGEIKKQILKLGDDGAEMRSLENVDDEYPLVGLEEEVEMLIRKRIIAKNQLKDTILIKGMCGIGKTTLAKEIYNHPTVVEHFERRAWVSNSTYFTIKELLIKLIQQVEDPQNLHTSSLLEDMDNPSLREILCQHLKGKRYLIVLDDVPKQIHLESFLEALPQQHGSRLLLTSHTTHMNLTGRIVDVYQMKPLDSNISWQLFLKTINHGNKLTGDHKFPMYLKHMGKQMLRKCDGLPLGIKEVGKQLAEKKVSGGGEWEQLLESVDFGSTLKLLEPFYHKLDPQLKSCFMSMAFFKENTTLRAEKLKQIWGAEGAELGSEFNSGKNLDGLINDSVIAVKEKSTEYLMNPLLHMLSIQKAEEKLGFEILRNNENNRPSQSPRHRVIICSRDRFNYSTNQDKHLVSLFFHGGGYLDTSPSYWKSFEQLKILDLEDFGLKILPESIGTLMNLRYLGLRNNYIQELPDSLGCLKKLKVLDIAQNFIMEVPNIIHELRGLRHLYLSNVIFRKPLKIQMLRKLKTLTYVSIENLKYELWGLQELEYLQTLGIEELDENSDVSKLFVSLADMKYLRHLILRGYRFRSMPCLDELGILDNIWTLKLDGLLARLPSNLPPNIRSLTLVNSCLDEDPMPLLGKLTRLDYLKLRNAYTGQQMVILHKSFCDLRVLCMEELWNLRNVQCPEYELYWLEKLEIHDCPYLDTLPETIVRSNNLDELKMVATKNIAAKMRKPDLISKIMVVNINP